MALTVATKITSSATAISALDRPRPTRARTCPFADRSEPKVRRQCPVRALRQGTWTPRARAPAQLTTSLHRRATHAASTIPAHDVLEEKASSPGHQCIVDVPVLVEGGDDEHPVPEPRPEMRRVAVTPSVPGMRMSMIATSGSVPDHRDGFGAVTRLATTTTSLSRGSGADRPSPEARRRQRRWWSRRSSRKHGSTRQSAHAPGSRVPPSPVSPARSCRSGQTEPASWTWPSGSSLSTVAGRGRRSIEAELEPKRRRRAVAHSSSTPCRTRLTA